MVDSSNEMCIHPSLQKIMNNNNRRHNPFTWPSKRVFLYFSRFDYTKIACPTATVPLTFSAHEARKSKEIYLLYEELKSKYGHLWNASGFTWNLQTHQSVGQSVGKRRENGMNDLKYASLLNWCKKSFGYIRCCWTKRFAHPNDMAYRYLQTVQIFLRPSKWVRG